MAKDLKLKVIIDADGNASSKIGGLSSALGGLGGIAGGILTGGLALAGAGIVALGAGLVTSVGAAMDAEAGQAELNAVIASTKGVAGVTADAANDLASKYQALTKFEDDAILSGENMLLTFTNIGKDVFPMATEATLNMAEKFGSMDQASTLVGKALQDPIAGVGALRKVGVKLTEQQEESIKSFMAVGDIASAQKIILGELETEFGGLAVAAGNTLTGKLAILQHTFGDIQETIGTAFLPILSQVADMMTTGLHSEFVQSALAGLTDFITTQVVPTIKGIGLAIQAFRDGALGSDFPWEDIFPPAVADMMYTISAIVTDTLMPAFDQLMGVVQLAVDHFDIIGPVLAAVGLALVALTGPIGAIGVAVGLLVAAWTQNWGGIQEKTQAVLDFLKPKWDDLVAVFDKFITLLLPELQKVWQELVTVWAAQVQPALAGLWASLQELFTALGLGTGKTDLWGVALTLLKGFLAGTILVVRNMIPVIRFLADGLVFMIGQVRTSIDRFIAFKQGVEGIVGAVGRLISRVRDLARYLADLVIPDFLQSNSPPPLQVGLEGIAAAAGRVGSKLPAAFAGLPSAGLAASLAGAGAMAAGGGVAPIIVNLTYSPLISTASKEEAQNILGPFIAEGIRRDKSGTR